CMLGEGYENIEELETAREFYKKATKLDPENPDAWYGIGSTLDAERRFQESLHYYKKAVTLDETDPIIWYALAQAHRELGQFEKAQKAFRKTVALDPHDYEAWLDFSALYVSKSNIDEAINVLTEAIYANDDVPELYYR